MKKQNKTQINKMNKLFYREIDEKVDSILTNFFKSKTLTNKIIQ